MTAPGWLFAQPFAHRGLWRADGPPENSMAAFAAAATHGLGAELDIRLSADGEAMVFHDADLARMTSAVGAVDSATAADLARMTLKGGAAIIPRLSDVLDAFPLMPLLVELKTSPGAEGPLEARAARLLAAHARRVGVMSFNPAALACFAQAAPGIPRGQLTAGVTLSGGRALPLAPDDDAGASMSRPDFLCCNVDALDVYGAPAAARLGVPLLTWTVRTPAQLALARKRARNWIFEALPVESAALGG